MSLVGSCPGSHYVSVGQRRVELEKEDCLLTRSVVPRLSAVSVGNDTRELSDLMLCEVWPSTRRISTSTSGVRCMADSCCGESLELWSGLTLL